MSFATRQVRALGLDSITGWRTLRAKVKYASRGTGPPGAGGGLAAFERAGNSQLVALISEDPSYFSDCLLHHKQPEPSGREGLADVRIVEAICESARTREVVELARFRKPRRPSLSQEIRRSPHRQPQPCTPSRRRAKRPDT